MQLGKGILGEDLTPVPELRARLGLIAEQDETLVEERAFPVAAILFLPTFIGGVENAMMPESITRVSRAKKIVPAARLHH
jgi:hypothetical protein